MDDTQFIAWLYGKKIEDLEELEKMPDTGHLGGYPAYPKVEPQKEEVQPIDPFEYYSVPIHSISRHRIRIDGDGISTLVTLKGCNLNCQYCLNPQCKAVDDKITLYTPQSLFDAVKIDDAYFQYTGGGITFSGGEPLLYPYFIKTFSWIVDKKWKIRIETSLYCDCMVFYDIYHCIDEWIIDIKSLNPVIYEAYTGGDFTIMKKFLDLISQFSFIRKRCIMRIPIIPGYTTEEDAQETKRILSGMGFSRFDIFSYNNHPKQNISNEGSAEENIYETDSSEDNSSKDKSGNTPLPSVEKYGKKRCSFFKMLRKKIAEKLGLKLSMKDCTYNGPCSGSCPSCDAELKRLNDGLQESQQ